MKKGEGNAMRKDIEWLKAEIDKQAIVMDKGYIYTGDLTYLINQLDEPEVLSQELPVIPKYVAVWIEQANKFHSISWLLNYRNIVDYSHELTLWCFESGNDDNLHKLARAWLDGYEVEGEQKYYVINHENYFLLAKDKWNGFIFSTGGNSRLGGSMNSSATFELTEQEIKDYDPRYMAFAEPVE